MPRVAALPSSVLPPDLAALYERFADGYADFRDQAAVLAHVPAALDGLYGMLLGLRESANLPLRHVELAVVTVSKLNACPYCVSHHAPLLAIEGVPQGAIDTLPGFDHPALDETDRLVVEYARLVTERAWGLRDGLFERLRARFSESQIVELTLRIALAGFFNRFNDALQIDDGRAAAVLDLQDPKPARGNMTMTDSSFAVNRRAVVAGLGSLPLAAALGRPAFSQAGGDVPIGMVLPFSGATGAYGPAMKQAADLAVSKINDEAGGLLGGRKIRLFIEDSESSPTASVAASKKLLEVNKVELVGGFWGSPEALAAKPIILAANKVQMLSCAANAVTEGETKGLIYRLQAKSSQWGPAGAKVMEKIGAKKVTVLAQQNPFIVAMVEPFRAEMAKIGGEVVDVVMYNPDQASYRAEVERAFGPEPDAVFVLPLLTDMVSISKEIYRGGFDSKVVSLGTGADAEGKFIQAVGREVSEGIYHLQPSPPIDSPSYAKFVKEMGAPAGTVFLFAGNAWDQICITALAMEHAKVQTAATWTKSIREVCNPPGEPVDDLVEALKLVREGKKINFNGAGCTCDFDDKGDSINRSFYVQLIKSGKNTPVGVVN